MKSHHFALWRAQSVNNFAEFSGLEQAVKIAVCRLGAEPERIGLSVWNQTISKRLNDRAGARGGALVGRHRWARILVITAGSKMAAMIFIVPHSGGEQPTRL